MSELLKRIDARTKLAGSNKLEMLLFSLGKDQRTGREETFGINVFKVREVMRIPEITRAPDMPPSVEGMVSLRGSLVPVIEAILERRPDLGADYLRLGDELLGRERRRADRPHEALRRSLGARDGAPARDVADVERRAARAVDREKRNM